MLAPEAWLALLRVVAGAGFLKAVWTKLALGFAWGVLPYPTVSARFIGFHPKRVTEFAAGNPIGWYKDFLEQTVLPNAAFFATLQVWGEVAVGIGLTLGFLTRLTALVGLYLATNFGLASQWRWSYSTCSISRARTSCASAGRLDASGSRTHCAKSPSSRVC